MPRSSSGPSGATSFTFGPGQVTTTLPVQTIDDNFPELPETVNVQVVPGPNLKAIEVVQEYEA